MYIAPNSKIKLLTKVPIDKNQSDTLWFASKGEQTAYFAGKAKRSFDLQTYQRVQRGYARVECPADQIYDCNYMMFQNTSYGNKWFYAFINNIEYINNEVSEVKFTIDPVQTWFFDYTLNQCFVERITPSSDEIGENILPEPVAVGEYTLNGSYDIIGYSQADTSTDFSKDMVIIVQYVNPNSSTGSGPFSEGSVLGGVYSGAELYVFGTGMAGQINEVNRLNAWIEAQAQHFDAIVGIYMCPILAIGGSLPPLEQEGTLDVRKLKNVSVISNTPSMPAITKNTVLNGYRPRNMKCYTYPYTFYHVDGPDSQSLIMRYEFFKNLTPKFRISANPTYPVEVNLFPCDYKNQAPNQLEPENEYRGEKLSIKGFPQCSWSMDSYVAWMAQNSTPLALNTIATIGQGVVSGAIGGPAGMTASGVSSLVGASANILSQYYTASIAADITKGSFSTGSNDIASRRMKFKGGCMTQPYNYLKAIDQFFDAFGYAKNEWMDVNIHQRSRWTYIKTVGANVDGAVPADDAKFIADCYDRGIRFWADTVHPCDYSIRNLFLS